MKKGIIVLILVFLLIGVIALYLSSSLFLKENDIILSTNRIELLEGESYTVEATILPEKTRYKKINWYSNDSTVAIVNDGRITGINEGHTIVKAVSENELATNVIEVIVKKKVNPLEKIEVLNPEISIFVGDKQLIEYQLVPSNVTDKKVVFSTDSNNISVDDSGMVTALNEGDATVILNSNGMSSEILVHVKVKETYFTPITSESKYRQGFSEVISYDSETLKYRIQMKNNNDYVLIWVKDAYMQLNSAIYEWGTATSGENILSREISKYSYQQKGLVAVNASYFQAGWGGTPGIPFVVNKGTVLRRVENRQYETVYGCMGVTKNGDMEVYNFSTNNYGHNKSKEAEIERDGVRNTFSYSLLPISRDGSLLPVDNNIQMTHRTVICQKDKNNFVIFSGNNTNVYQVGKEMKEFFDCKIAVNLDGGGSRKLYYKTSSMSSPAKRFSDPGRVVADMLYFSE